MKEIKKETSDCVSVAFDVPAHLKEQFAFTQGQNITIKFFAGEEIRRSYSICSSPAEDELRIAVKKVPNGAFSSFANEGLKEGNVLEVMAPSGTFFTEVNPTNKKNYIFFAAGSGITPVISLIKTVLGKEPMSNVTLIYGNRNVSSIIFKENLEALKDKYLQRFRIYYIFSRERTDSAINFGRIDAKKCSQFSKLINFDAADEFFICGPEKMIFNVKEFLEDKGIDKKKIHFELFTTPTRKHIHIYESVKPATNNGSNITIRLDGRSFNFNLDYDSNNILDAALAEGADLPFACKGGVCCTCKSKLLEGKVEMEANYGLEADEVEAGFILTCQSHPRSENVVIDFDVKS